MTQGRGTLGLRFQPCIQGMFQRLQLYNYPLEAFHQARLGNHRILPNGQSFLNLLWYGRFVVLAGGMWPDFRKRVT